MIEQVKLLEEAVEKEIFKDLVSVNMNANQFIYIKLVEPEEKKAEDKRITEEKRIAEENAIKLSETIHDEKIEIIEEEEIIEKTVIQIHD